MKPSHTRKTFHDILEGIPVVGIPILNLIKRRGGIKEKIGAIVLIIITVLACLYFARGKNHTTSFSASADNSANSLVALVNQSSNVSVRINSQNATFQIGNVTGGNNQFGFNNTQIVNGFTDTGEISNLEQKTAGLNMLPDGRILIGSIVSGNPSVIDSECSLGTACFTNKNFGGAMIHYQKAFDIAKASDTLGYPLQINFGIYMNAAISAENIGSNGLANNFALQSAQTSDPTQMEFSDVVRFISYLHWFAAINFGREDYNNSYLLGKEAVRRYEYICLSASTHGMSARGVGLVEEAKRAVSSIPKKAKINMYDLVCASALQIGKTNESVEFQKKATEILTGEN